MPDYPVRDGKAATIVATATDPAWTAPPPHDRSGDYPVVNGNGDTIVAEAFEGSDDPEPEPSFARTASVADTHHVHSGHSLTDAYVHYNTGNYPGDLNKLFIGQFGQAAWVYEVTHLKDTTPGSQMAFRWDENGPDRAGIGNFDVLMITEGGPPRRPTPEAPTAANPSLDYLFRFAENAYLNGRGDGAGTILWSIWPDKEGWIGAGGTNETIWAPFGGFRNCLDEYGRVFRFYAEYVTWKMHQTYPELPDDWRIYTFPGHAWMARLYDDIQMGLVPGITDHRQLFADEIHLTDAAEYGTSVFVHTMLYQTDTRSGQAYVPSAERVSPELDAYFRRVAWEIATSEESVGMGGTANAAPSFDLVVYGDPLATEGGGGEEPPPDEDAVPPADAIIVWDANGYTGPARTGGVPTVVAEEGVVRFPGGLATTYALGQSMTGFYACICGRNSGAAVNFIRQMIGLTNTTNSFNSSSRLDLNKFVNGLSVRHNPSSGEVNSNSGTQNLDEFLTVEGWLFEGTIGIAINGVTIIEKPTTAPVVTTANIVLMNSGNAGSDYDMRGMVVLNRMPTELEDAANRAWAAKDRTL